MIKHKYGQFSEGQLLENITSIRKKIFFLLLCGDPKTKNQFDHINLNDAIKNVIDEVNGLNEILEYQYAELVSVIALLESARKKIGTFSSYRKTILEAGAKMQHLEEVM